ncbi:hypothetical protein ACOSQ4_029768 [Xanthoceras sorbifolium]
MDTRSKTNAEFRTEVMDILQRHEASFNQLNAALQTIMTNLQSLQLSRHSNTMDSENPFAPAELSHQALQTTHTYPTPISDRNHHLKLSFPKFNGDDPTRWIYKFTTTLLLRFGPTDYDDPSEALTRLKQTTTVASYQEAFEKLSHCVDNLPEHFLVGCFISSLRDDIRLNVKVKQPKTLSDTIGVARLIEERNSLYKKANGSNVYRPSNTAIYQRNQPPPNTGLLSPLPIQRGRKRMSDVRKGFAFIAMRDMCPVTVANVPNYS